MTGSNSTPPNQPPERSKSAPGLDLGLIGRVALWVALIVAITACLTFTGGMLLDRLLDTGGLFTVILFVAGAPLAMVLSFLVAQRVTKNASAPPPQPSLPSQEEQAPSDD